MSKFSKPIMSIVNLVLSAVIALFGFGCKTKKNIVPENNNDNKTPKTEKKIMKPDDQEPVKCLYGVPVTIFRIRGTVTDQSDKPLEHIRITVKNAEDAKLGQTVTDNSGQFNIAVSKRFTNNTESLKLVYDDLMGAYQSDSTENSQFNTQHDGFTTNAELEVKQQLKKK